MAEETLRFDKAAGVRKKRARAKARVKALLEKPPRTVEQAIEELAKSQRVLIRAVHEIGRILTDEVGAANQETEHRLGVLQDDVDALCKAAGLPER